MYLLTTITEFKLAFNDLRKIAVQSYIRNGKLVRNSNRLIKKKLLTKLNTKTKSLNYFNTNYNKRLAAIQKEEISNWSKKLNNMNIKQLPDITDWDDSRTVLEYIQEDIKKYPNSFRSISHEGKVVAMATVSEDKTDKCLKVRNLLSNPDRLENNNIKGAGVMSIIHMIEESIELGYEGRLRLTALPKASKFYEKLGFKLKGSKYNFQYELDKDTAQSLIDNHMSNFSSSSNIKEALKLEKYIYVFAINKN